MTTTDLSRAETALTDPPAESEHGALPLAPIDVPPGIFLKLLFALARRRYGKTPTAFRVVYARAPAIVLVTLAIVVVLERFLRLEPTIRYLAQIRVASEVGCTFCVDLALAEVVRSRIGAQRFAHLHRFEEAEVFGERERAALAYAVAVSRSLHVPDAVIARLRRSFDEREVAELVFVCAVERYFNGMALPLRIGSDGLSGLELPRV